MTIRLSSLLLVLFAGALSAAEPSIRSVSVRGLQIGGTTALAIDGDGLTATPKLLLPFPFTSVPQPKGTDKTAMFAVTVPDTVTPGWYHLRVTTVDGISLPVLIGVDRLPQLPFAAKSEKLPVALHGVLVGSAVVETKFDGKAKQKVTIEVEAQRLGSKLRPILHLIGPDKKQLAWNWGRPAMGGDCRLEATLPTDGTYTVTIHDAEYAGAAPGHFRLKVGEFAAVDQVFPPVVGSGTKSVELLGSAGPAGVTLPAKGDAGIQRLAWPAGGNWTGPQPFVPVSTRTEIVETVSAAPQGLPTGAIGVSGKLSKANEEDRYRLPTTPGAKLRFDLSADRLGSPLDVSLVLRTDAGTEIARADDGPGTLDPTLDFTVPEKTTSILVCVVDAQGQGGPRGVYRFTVDAVKPEPVPSLKLFTPTGRVSIPANGVAVVPVVAERTNFPGPIRLTAAGLPRGVKLENAIIPDGADGTLVVLKATGAAGEATVTTWGSEGVPVVVRSHPLERIQPWMAQEVSVAVVPAPLSVAVAWKNVPADLAIVPTRKFALPVTVTRPDTNTVVRLTLLTGQFVPLANGVPDATKAVRAANPVEVAVKATDGEVSVLVPTDVPTASCDVSVMAEVLTADRKTILATAFTPVKRLPVKMPATIKLATAKAEAKLDPKLGYVAEFTGTAERLAGVTGDITLAVAGLPPGARLEPASAKVAGAPVSVKLIFPAAAAPGPIPGLKLTATVAPDPKVPAVLVKCREVELNVSITAKK